LILLPWAPEPFMKILLIEDDRETATHILTALGEAGHQLDHAADGQRGLALAVSGNYDVLVVDRMLPLLDGLSLVKAVRNASVRIPVLFLSNLDGVDDRVIGLDAGGDDYLTKPFARAELLARVAALGRRLPLATIETSLRCGDLEMDLVAHSVRRGGVSIELLPREWQLLECLMRNADRVVTRTMLLEQVWDFHFDPGTNVVETHVSRLRQKIDRGRPSELIHTVRGIGYQISVPS